MTRLEVRHNPANTRQAEFASAILAYAPAGWEVSLGESPEECDVVLSLDPETVPPRGAYARSLLYWFGQWPDRLDDFYAAALNVDGVLFACRRYWQMLGPQPHFFWVPPAYDSAIFSAAKPSARSPHILWMLPRDARWRRGGDWLRNPESLSDELKVSAEAWPEGALPKARADAARGATVLVCADDLQDRSQELLEAAACGCSILCTEAARLPTWLRAGHRVAPSLKDVPVLLREILAAPHSAQEDTVAEFAWQHRANTLFATLAESKPRHIGENDLRKELTVFVTTVGAPSYAACIEHLRTQDCRFHLEIIENVAPMSAAFQHMLDHCTTPVYVQVDEDMLLYPHAVRTLYAELCASEPEVPLVVGWLHDAHLDRSIQGVKAYRHELVRRYPYVDERSCEIGQLSRMAADGLCHRVLAASDESPLVLGLHGTHWTPEAIYERFYTLECVRQKLPANMSWLESLPAWLLERYLARGSQLDLYALLGTIAGAAEPTLEEGVEKDYRVYGQLPGQEASRIFVEKLLR